MSLLVRYTLKSADAHAAQVAAMQALVAGLKSEAIAGLQYSGFSTDDPKLFVGMLEFPDDSVKKGFLDSAAFATYRAAVTPHLAHPPETTAIAAIATTRD